MERDHRPPETVEVFVRSLSPEGSPQQRSIFEQLKQVSREGVIDYWTVHVVGDRVCPDTASATQSGQFICGRIQRFKEWADRSGMSFGEFFERRQVSSELADEEYESMKLPSVTLAEFDEEDTLSFVSPSFDDGTKHTPMDRLERIVEAGREDTELTV